MNLHNSKGSPMNELIEEIIAEIKLDIDKDNLMALRDMLTMLLED